MIYMTLSSKEILHTINDTKSKLLMVLDPAIPKVKEIQTDLSIPIIILSVADSMPVHLKMGYCLKNKARLDGALTYHEFLKKGVDTAHPTEATSSEKMAVIVYTSGTTGEPKGVMLSDDNMNHLALANLMGIFPYDERQLSFFLIIPPFTGFGISELHLELCGGLELTLQINISQETVAKNLYKYKPNIFASGPPFVDAIMNYKGNANLKDLRFFIGGGGAIAEDKEIALNNFLKQKGSTAKYSNGYGMTEACSVLCASCNDISKIGSVGIPYTKTTVKVVDAGTNRELPYMEKGELHFSAPNIMLGYFHNKVATDDMTYTDENGERWLKTGDLGYVDEDGFVFVTGRIKRVAVTRNHDGIVLRLFLQHIEETIGSDDAVEACGVIAREDAERINIAIAFVTLKDKSLSGERRDAIRTRLFALAEQELPEHEQPVDIRIIDTMPLTPSGKIDYRALEQINS